MSWATKVLLALGTVLLASSAAHAATIPVTTTADVVANDGACSLREAVFAARFDASTPATLNCTPGSGEDVVQLEAATYALAAGGVNEDGNESGDLDTGPASALRVAGRGTAATVIGAAGNRAFDVFAGASLGLSDLTVRDAAAPSGSSGGAVRNKGTLTVLRVAFINNAGGDGRPAESIDGAPGEDGGGGGAIASEGQLQVADSLFSLNRAGNGADGRHFEEPSPTGTRRVDRPPRPGGSGGAILVSAGTASIASSTFTASRAGDGGDRPPDGAYTAGGNGGAGGAIAVTGGSASVVNATFQGDRAGNAGSPRFGGIDEEAVPGSGGAAAAVAPGSMSITFSTFSGNARGTGPGGIVGSGASVFGATVAASILADAGGACATMAPSPLANVVLPGDTSCLGARIVGDPRLGPLTGNGGPTPTMLPGAGSPAVDALVGVPCPPTDQRGLPRPRFGGCDAGAIEVQPGEPVAPSVARAGTGTGAKARRVSSLQLRPTAFRAAGSGGSIGKLTKALTQRKPIGATVSYRLNGAARVTFTITRPVPGRRKGRACVRPGAARPGAKACLRQKKLRGSFAHQGVAGLNSFRFTGRLRRKALALGPYRLVARLPRPATGRAALAGKGFRIVR